MLERHWFINDRNDNLTESDYSFLILILQGYFLNILYCSQYNAYSCNTHLIVMFIGNIFYITYLSIENQQQQKKSSPYLQHFQISMV